MHQPNLFVGISNNHIQLVQLRSLPQIAGQRSAMARQMYSVGDGPFHFIHTGFHRFILALESRNVIVHVLEIEMFRHER